MSGAGHPSFYALDRVRLGDAPTAEERTHLAVCEACAAYVRPEGAAPAAPLPAWLANVRLPPAGARPSEARPGGWRLLWPTLTVAAAAVGLVALWPRPAPEDSASGVREKGAPAVQLFVKRGERVFAWTGRAVQPGDRLRVEVNGAGFGFVSVAGRSAAQSQPVVLYDGSLGSGAQLLPVSFRVDAEGKQEILSVIFGRRPIPAELHARAQETQEAGGGGTEAEAGRRPKKPAKEEGAAGAGTFRQILVLDKEIR